MGLDMYLVAERYVGGWKHSDDSEKSMFRNLVKAAGFSLDDVSESSPSFHARLNVAYWRKANAIHGWFVDKVQNGVDECQESYVTREQLQELVEACKEGIASKGKSLKPRSGFFFGSVEIDDYYFEDLKYTVLTIEKILKNPRLEGCEFYYRASW